METTMQPIGKDEKPNNKIFSDYEIFKEKTRLSASQVSEVNQEMTKIFLQEQAQ
jgi:hypothetical protein